MSKRTVGTRAVGGTKKCGNPACEHGGVLLPVSEFSLHDSHADGLQSNCNDCRNVYKRGQQALARAEALAALGGCCMRCGISDERVLQIDHVLGDGAADRNHNSVVYYRTVAAAAASGRYQLLCANCHVIKSRECGEQGRPRRTKLPVDTGGAVSHTVREGGNESIERADPSTT